METRRENEDMKINFRVAEIYVIFFLFKIFFSDVILTINKLSSKRNKSLCIFQDLAHISPSTVKKKTLTKTM